MDVLIRGIDPVFIKEIDNKAEDISKKMVGSLAEVNR